VGILFSDLSRARLFDTVLKGTLLQPGRGHAQTLRDLDTIREFLTGSGLISFCDAPWVPIFVVGCFILHPWFGYIATTGAVLIFCFAAANELLTRTQLKAASSSSIIASSYVSATFRNAEVLHAMGMLPALRDRWLERQDEGLELQAAASDRAGYLVAASKFLRVFLQIGILGTGPYLSIVQESTPGAMIAASIIMGRALAPVELAVANWKGFIAARSAYDRILSLFGILPEEVAKMPLPAPQGHLAAENIVAVPPGAKEPVLRGVSFALRPGEVLGVLVLAPQENPASPACLWVYGQACMARSASMGRRSIIGHQSALGGTSDICHRTSTNVLATVDKILVLSNGQVAAFGSRDEILSKLLGPRLAPAAAA
jgi:ABC-type protease/lipase transport system fused ATPase/permease subunit